MYINILDENPINLIDVHPNLLGCRDLADSLTSLATKVPPNSLVGFWGDWGSGKSRVLHFTEQKLAEKTDHIVFLFNPWLSANEKNWISRLQNSLLETEKIKTLIVENELEKSIKDKSKEFAQKKRLNIEKAIFNTIAEFLGFNTENLPVLHPEDIDMHELQCISWNASIEHIRDRGTARDIDLKIFVLIDDLDRCHPKYIRDVLDTIYGSLRTSNVVFIIATDRNSITSSMRELLPGNEITVANQYLEKLIAIDLNMPSPSMKQVEEFVKCHLSATLLKVDDFEVMKWLSQVKAEIPQYLGDNTYHGLDENKISNLVSLIESADDNFLINIIKIVGDNPRRIKRVLVRYIQAAKQWNEEFTLRKKNIPKVEEYDLASSAASCFQCVIGLIVLREHRPDFFEKFCSNYHVALLTLFLIEEYSTTGSVAKEHIHGLKLKLENNGVFTDPVICNIAIKVELAVAYYFAKNDPKYFELPFLIATMV